MIYATVKFIPAVSIYNQTHLQNNLQNQLKPVNKFYCKLKQTVPSFDFCASYPPGKSN